MKRWIIAIICLYGLASLMMCYNHRRPVGMNNDTNHTAKIYISAEKISEKIDVLSLRPNEGTSAPHCSEEYKFIYLSTPSHPDMVVYRMKDFCDLDDCSCEINVSHLETQRNNLSVPWEKAGDILPPGMSH